MTRWIAATLTLALLLTGAATAWAEEAKPKKPLGTWTKTDGDNSITFHFKSDSMLVTLKNASGSCTVDADYGITKAGVVFGVITNVKNEGIDGPPEGMLFSFQVEVDKDTLTIKDLKGTDNEEAKKAVQGEYKKKGK
jgi:hypothetical protein